MNTTFLHPINATSIALRQIISACHFANNLHFSIAKCIALLYGTEISFVAKSMGSDDIFSETTSESIFFSIIVTKHDGNCYFFYTNHFACYVFSANRCFFLLYIDDRYRFSVCPSASLSRSLPARNTFLFHWNKTHLLQPLRSPVQANAFYRHRSF